MNRELNEPPFSGLGWRRGEKITLQSLSERIDELESSFDEFARVIVDYIVDYGGEDE